MPTVEGVFLGTSPYCWHVLALTFCLSPSLRPMSRTARGLALASWCGGRSRDFPGGLGLWWRGVPPANGRPATAWGGCSGLETANFLKWGWKEKRWRLRWRWIIIVHLAWPWVVLCFFSFCRLFPGFSRQTGLHHRLPKVLQPALLHQAGFLPQGHLPGAGGKSGNFSISSSFSNSLGCNPEIQFSNFIKGILNDDGSVASEAFLGHFSASLCVSVAEHGIANTHGFPSHYLLHLILYIPYVVTYSDVTITGIAI